MTPRPDLLSPASPRGPEVFQLTDEAVPSSHVYMEAQVFSPDGRRLVLHRSAHPHGSDRRDPAHRYLVCDLETGDLAPLTDGPGATSPAVSPEGDWVYYFAAAGSRVNAGRFELVRVALDGSRRETVCVVDAPLPGAETIPSDLYVLSTISSDGLRLATSAFLGDGVSEDPDFGLLVFDLERGRGEVVLTDPFLSNAHPQYCRSRDPGRSRDVLFQHMHGWRSAPDGARAQGLDELGCDLHVVRDDGSGLRDLPVGRDGAELCQGHQCWRGGGEWIIAGTGVPNPAQRHGWGQELVECLASPHSGHLGKATPGGVRQHLSSAFDVPDFRHFQTDRAGERLVSDCGPFDEGGRLFVAELAAPGGEPARWTYLLDLRTSDRSEGHPHPFLSPDGSRAFFNSDESGVLQAYMVTGLDGL